MSSPTRLLMLGALVLHVDPIAAQSPLGSEQQDVRNLRGDIWAVWTSPARLRRADIVPLAGALGLIGIAALRDSATWAWMSNNPKSLGMRALGPIREGWRFPLYELGSGQYILPLSAALYAAGRLSRDANLRDAGLGCASSYLASLGVRVVVLRAVARSRPRVTPQPFQFSFPGSNDWSRQSFTSGHISNSMACASFLGHRFSLGIAEPLPYAYSAAIGLGRLADGRHWLSDTMTGALIGFAIGKAVATRQLGRRADAAAPAGSIALFPSSTFRWSFNF